MLSDMGGARIAGSEQWIYTLYTHETLGKNEYCGLQRAKKKQGHRPCLAEPNCQGLWPKTPCVARSRWG